MDLCNKEYGFIHLPTLIVFVNPFSRFKAVKDFFLQGSPVEVVEDPIPSLSQEEGRDLLQRLSSLFHEQKHFHDLLLTPYGNHLVRLGFKYAIAASVLFADRNWEAESHIELPLQPGSIKHSQALERALRIRGQYAAALQSARLTMEASATLAQTQFIWTHYGSNSTFSLQEDFAAVEDYSSILDGFIEAGKKLGFTRGEFGALTHRLLLITLGRSDPPDSFKSHDDSLKYLLTRIRDLSPAQAEQLLEKAIKQAWAVVEENLEVTDSDNESFLAEIEKVMSWAHPSVKENTVRAFDDFRVKSKAFRSQFFKDKGAYFRLDRYANGESNFVEPLLYLYSVEDALSLHTEPLDLESDDLVATVNYKAPDTGLTYYSHRLIPGEFTLGGVPMDRPTWISFARSIGGAPALLEEVNWLHPLKTFWLRQVEKQINVRFKRRL